jgi:ribonuclease HII
MILGIDEVGRGPWAGPLVIGAVVLGGVDIPGLTDSKKLSKKRRKELDIIIREKAAGFGLGWVEANEIDEIGLSAALRLATIRAVEQVKATYHEIIIDGTINFLADTNKGKYVTTMPKADLLIPCVSAASIIAKVARDEFMSSQDKIYDGYDFSGHVGYGTAKHIEAIKQNGTTPLHRLSFAPLKKYKKETTKTVGDRAEETAADYLKKHGHAILARNYKKKTYEIDIVSKKDGVIFFNEVKYRSSDKAGDGLAAINNRKQKQMEFSAKCYIQEYQINCDVCLMAISLSGQPPTVDDYLEIY